MSLSAFRIDKGHVCIVTEFCEGGNLFSCLHENKQIELSWKQRIKMSLDVARAMNFLHSFNPPILHRDLKSLKYSLFKFKTLQSVA